MEETIPEIQCNICGAPVDSFASAELLRRHHVRYFRCIHCGAVQSEQPYWLEEAYDAAINSSDVGLLGRNIALSRVCRVVIAALFNGKGTFVDYGGGYGALVRLMRDFGLDFYRYDRYCENLFAADFEAEVSGQAYELLTAFEVFEHLVNPVRELEEMLKWSRNILFSTELIPAGAPGPADWSYYGVDHGQHVSFFTLKALQTLAGRFHLNLFSNGVNLHLMTDKRVSPFLFNILTNSWVASLYSLLPASSLLVSDHARAVRRVLQTRTPHD